MKVDMSPEAISRRLREFDQIWEVCMALSKSRIIPSPRKIAEQEVIGNSPSTDIGTPSRDLMSPGPGMNPKTSHS